MIYPVNLMMGKLIYTALVTPFTKKDSIDFDSVKKLILKLKNQKTQGVVLAGSTGEAATLSKEEKLELFEFGSRFRDKNFKIMAGVGSNNTLETVDFVKKVNKIKLDSYLVVSPYYNKPGQEDLFYHFSEIAENSNVPNCIYEIPSRTGVSIAVDTVIKLSRQKNIFALKDSNPDLMRIFRIKTANPKFIVFSGDDATFLPSLSLGADGLISVLSHVIAPELVSIASNFEKGNFSDCLEFQEKVLNYSDKIFSVTNPVGIKGLLSHKKIILGGLRAPLRPLKDKAKFLFEGL